MPAKTVCLNDVGTITTGMTPTPRIVDSESPHTIPFLTPSDIEDRQTHPNTERFVSDPDSIPNISKRILPALSTCVTCIGASIGKTVLIHRPMLTNQQINSVTPDPDYFDPRFIYYATLIATKRLADFSGGSATPILNKSSFGELRIPYFELPVQQGISGVLGSLDDKIAANNQIVRCSIELCSALISATMGGGTASLSDVAEVNMGTSPKGEFLNETGDGKPFFQGVRDFGKLFPSNRVFTQNAVRVANSGDILFAVRAPIGQVNIANEDCAIGRGVAAIRGKEHHLTLFYLLLSHQEIWDIFQDNGTVFASINRADLNGAPIPWPSDPARIEKTIAPIHARAMEALRENEVLARTRDELLPLLMSGRITVAGASRSGVGAGVEGLLEGMS